MGPPVHVALISPGEMETEDVFVKEVTKSREKAKKNHLIFATTPLFFSFKHPNKHGFVLKCCSAHTANIPPKISEHC